MRQTRFTVHALHYLVLFAAVFAVAVYVQYSPTIGDPDGFYHAKIALFLSEGRVLQSLPWMQFSTLRDQFTDHHFLYHAALVPFVLFGKPLLGVKLATAVFTAAFFTLLYWVLRRWKTNAPLLAMLTVLFCNAFLFRLGLVKANSLSLIVFLLVLVALFERRIVLVFCLNALYVLLYGGWALGFVLAGALLFSSIAHRLLTPLYTGRHFFRAFADHSSWALFFATLLGSLAGLVANPYWPQNLSFYVQQVWQIAIVGASPVSVGGEWTGFAPGELIQELSWISVLGVIGFLTIILNRSRIQLRTWTLAVLSVLFVLFTLKSRRYIELSAPTVVLFAASAWSDVFPKHILKQLWQQWTSAAAYLREQWLVMVSIVLMGVIALPQVGLWSRIDQTRAELSRGIPIDRYAKVSAWLAAHTPPDSIVLHSDWDDWPILFYRNDHNRYIVGLDPTFMYNFDPALYRAWAALTGEGQADNLVSLVTQTFASRYVLIEKDHTSMQAVIAGNIFFRLVYEDDEVWVYHFTEST